MPAGGESSDVKYLHGPMTRYILAPYSLHEAADVL